MFHAVAYLQTTNKQQKENTGSEPSRWIAMIVRMLIKVSEQEGVSLMSLVQSAHSHPQTVLL